MKLTRREVNLYLQRRSRDKTIKREKIINRKDKFVLFWKRSELDICTSKKKVRR